MSEYKSSNKIRTADAYKVWNLDESVRIHPIALREYPPISIPSFYKDRCETARGKLALATKRNGSWEKWSYDRYLVEIRSAAKAFIKAGLEPRHTVCVLSFNSPEWFFSAIGAIFAGGVITGLYTTNLPETNEYVINDCRCQILVVEDLSAFKKILPILNNLKFVKKIILCKGDVPELENVVSWSEFIEWGRSDEEEGSLRARIENQAVNDCCMLVYTSGTSGNPKGVMLSHDNILFTSRHCSTHLELANREMIMVSYLPLNHIAGCLLDIFTPALCLGTTYFADKAALKGTLVDTLKEVRPTHFFAVPRVWEKMHEAMVEKGSANKGLKKQLIDSCKKAGYKRNLNDDTTVMYKVGKKIVYKKVKEHLGLDRCVEFFSGAAPLNPDTQKYFMGLDMPLHSVYGQSECTGVSSICSHGRFRFESIGKVPEYFRMSVQDADPDSGDGELVFHGRPVMMGYLHCEEKTKETIDEDNWLHSGDVGRMDKDGFFYITGRIKEIIVTSGGENISPIPIEDRVKSALPCLGTVVVIGNKRKFLSLFVAFKVEVDPITDVPTNKLSNAAVDWCRSVGCEARTVEDILKGPNPRVMKAIQEGIDWANKKAVSNAGIIQRWTIMPKDISVASGELTATLKLKRFYFDKKYSKVIDSIYNN